MTLPISILVYTRDEFKRRELVHELSDRLDNMTLESVSGVNEFKSKLESTRTVAAIIDIHQNDPIAPQVLRMIRSEPILKELPVVFLHDERRATHGLGAETSRNWLSRDLGSRVVVDRLIAMMPSKFGHTTNRPKPNSDAQAQGAFRKLLEEIETDLATLDQSGVGQAVRKLERCSSQLRPFGLEEASSSALLPLRQHPNPTRVEVAQAVREFRHITDSLTQFRTGTRAAVIGAQDQQLAALSEAWGDRVDLKRYGSIEDLRYSDLTIAPNLVVLFDEKPAQTSKALQALRYLGALTQPVVVVIGNDTSPPLPDAENYGADLVFDATTPVDEIATRIIAEHQRRIAERPRAILLEDAPGDFEPLIKLLESTGINAHVTHRADLLENLARLDTSQLVVLHDTYSEVSGLDICRTLKSQNPAMLASLLILYNPESVVPRSHFFNVGADDAMAWPPEQHELMVRVRNLVERTLALRTHAEKDDVTGLEHACALPKRLQARATPGYDGLSVLSLCVDDFDALRTRYGASAAKTVLRTVADQIVELLDDHTVFRGWGATFYALSPAPLDKLEIKELGKAFDDMRRTTFRTRDGRGFYVTLHAAHLRVDADVANVTTILNSLSRLASRAAASTRILSAQLNASDDPDAPLRLRNVSNRRGDYWTPVVLTQSDD